MADRYTTNDDAFTPQRIGELIVDTVYDQLAILNTPAVTELGATFINGGNTVTFPVFNGVQGDFSDLDCTDSTGAAPEVVYSDMDYETADVVSKIIDVGIKGCTLDDAYKAENFTLIDATLEDVGNKASKIVDAYLVSLAAATDLSYTIPSSGTMNRTGVIKAKVQKWGDLMANMSAIFVCHSKVYGDIQDEVKDVYNPVLNNGVNQGGYVSLYLGMPVVVSDRCPVDGSNNYTSFVLGPGAIGFDFQRELSYKVIAERGDKYVHEFVTRYFGKLKRRNGKNLAIKIISK